MADLRTFRVQKPFDWNGVALKPGDVWLVDMSDGRANRVQMLLDNRFAGGDASTPTGAEAKRDPKLRKQLPKTPVGAGG